MMGLASPFLFLRILAAGAFVLGFLTRALEVLLTSD